MAINTQSFTQTLTNAVTAVQGAATALVDFSVGAISLAYMQAVTAMSMWLQALILQVAALTRLATSSGADVDTFLADFGTSRLGASVAKGVVTFARYTPTLQAQIPAGSVVETADGTELFNVIADTNQGAWNAGLNAYVILAGGSSCTATVQAQVAGSGGNVALGTVTVLAQSIPGVDTVTNAAAFSGGLPAESDTAAKAGFVTYLQSLTQGTKQACINAVTELQEGATCYIIENQTYSPFGIFQAGYFSAICDDGTGAPSSGFLTACYAAIDAVRAIGTTFGVFAPAVVYANVGMTITVATGYTLATVEGLVTTAITNYINTLGLGVTLSYFRLAQVAYDASPGITSVTAVLLDSGTADLVPTAVQLVKAGSIVVG